MIALGLSDSRPSGSAEFLTLRKGDLYIIFAAAPLCDRLRIKKVMEAHFLLGKFLPFRCRESFSIREAVLLQPACLENTFVALGKTLNHVEVNLFVSTDELRFFAERKFSITSTDCDGPFGIGSKWLIARREFLESIQRAALLVAAHLDKALSSLPVSFRRHHFGSEGLECSFLVSVPEYFNFVRRCNEELRLLSPRLQFSINGPWPPFTIASCLGGA